MVFKKKQHSESDVEHILNVQFYEHKAIMGAMTAPLKSLESETGRFNDGLVSVQLCVSLLEKFAWAAGTLKDTEPELDAFLEKEREKMRAEGLTDLLNERALARLSYAKLAWIYKKIYKEMPSSTEYIV